MMTRDRRTSAENNCAHVVAGMAEFCNRSDADLVPLYLTHTHTDTQREIYINRVGQKSGPQTHDHNSVES